MRFGISDTSWMLPKILRMRLVAVERCSVAGAALVAMEIFCLVCLPRRMPGSYSGCAQTQKAAFSSVENRSFSVRSDPSQSIRAMHCATAHHFPKGCGDGGYLVKGRADVKGRGSRLGGFCAGWTGIGEGYGSVRCVAGPTQRS